MEASESLLSRVALTERLEVALERAGLEVSFDGGRGNRPVLMTVSGSKGFWRLRVFLWNTRGGGRGRPPNERRVQTTRPGGVPFLTDDGRTTLLLGYHRRLDVFSTWDVRRHPNPGPSSSLQVDVETLEEANRSGFTSQSRSLAGGHQEVVVAFSPDNVRTYLEMLPSFQVAVADSSSDAALGAAITTGAEPADEDLPSDVARRVAVRTVTQLVRDSRFRTRVIRAHGGKCAFCGAGLGLADAAHIQSVRDGGPDLVANGLCACPTHHRAFDRGLLVVENDFKISLNRRLITELGFQDDEVAKFEAGLFETLDVPDQDSPAPEYLAQHHAKWLDD